MRVRLSTTFITLLTLGGVFAQDSAELPALTNPHNYVKLLAQEAALPVLRGGEKFILRESWWSGSLDPGKAKLIQVQLFRRNSYQFWLAVPSRAAEPLINIYDSDGNLVPSDQIESDQTNIVSTVIEPEMTGVYYIRVSLKTTIDSAQDWAVIYAYR